MENKLNEDAEVIDKYALVVPDFLKPNLDIIFVGINPGIKSAQQKHHYANPTNAFWPCLYESGLLSERLIFQDDFRLPDEYNYGLTNLVARSTRGISDLTKQEMKESVPILMEKLNKYRPLIVCFVGMGIYQIFADKKTSKPGLQTDAIRYSDNCAVGSDCSDLIRKESLVFVVPSTSGRTSAYKKSDKLQFFTDLFNILKKLKEKNLLCPSSLPESSKKPKLL